MELTKEIEKERQVILEELHQVNDVPSQKAFLLNDSLLWPNQPLGRDIGGTPETVNSITKDMMLDYMRDQYRPNNVVLVVAGQIDKSEVEDLVASSSLNLQDIGKRELIPAVETELDNPIIVEYRATEQAHICLSFPGISIMDRDRYSLDLLNTVLGEGMASRLFLSLTSSLLLKAGVIAYGLLRKLDFAIDPSPLPVGPWQCAHIISKSSLP